jgi:GNAT superfamily N-acetyltransferase
MENTRRAVFACGTWRLLMTEVMIQRMTREDLFPLVELLKQLGYESTLQQVVARFERLDKDDDYCLLAARTSEGAVVGCVFIHGYHTLESDPCAEVGGMVVDEQHRRRSVGRNLMMEAERWALGKGYSEIFLRTTFARTAAHRFYESLGYSVWKEQYIYHKLFPEPLLRTEVAGVTRG